MPIKAKDHPNYYTMIPNPIFFRDIRRKIEKNQYEAQSFQVFQIDVEQCLE